MKVQVNGEWRELEADDLAGALAELGYGAAVVASALNGEFVGAGMRASTALTEGDRIEVLSPMQGG